jgi:transposase
VLSKAQPKEATRMDLHANAALSWTGRRQLARRVVREGWTVMAAAEAAGVSVRCARKWIGRYRAGDRRLLDRSSVPRWVANRTAAERIEVIVKLRRLRMTSAEIAETLAMPLSTVSGILTRLGLGRLGRVGCVNSVPGRARGVHKLSRVFRTDRFAARSNKCTPTASLSSLPPCW